MMLGHVLARYRWAQQITVRDAAKVMGISAATLSRIEHGEMMDGMTMAKILIWLLAVQP
jgi:transcriptional regulator with XRE-family HTH domain